MASIYYCHVLGISYLVAPPNYYCLHTRNCKLMVFWSHSLVENLYCFFRLLMTSLSWRNLGVCNSYSTRKIQIWQIHSKLGTYQNAFSISGWMSLLPAAKALEVHYLHQPLSPPDPGRKVPEGDGVFLTQYNKISHRMRWILLTCIRCSVDLLK